MKKRMLVLMLAALLLLPGCRAAAAGDQTVQLFAANVGKGDALLLRVDGYACLIDAGKPWAAGRVRSAMEAMGVTALDAVFLTHTDQDHAGGLAWLAESDIPVGAWYAPAMYTGVKAAKHPAVKAADARGEAVRWLQRGDAIPLGNTGASLSVLAPDRVFEDKDDNNSLVMRLDTDQGRMLLTGDMELPEEAVLLSQGDDLACAVLKVPNHADDDTCSQAFLNAVAAQVAVISTDSLEKPGTPDPGVLQRLVSAGTVSYVTQDTGLGLRVALDDGIASVEPVDIDAPLAQGAAITAVVPSEDTVTLENSGPDLDLTGCYLYSDRGNELCFFPDGCVLPAGQSLTVGTRSTNGGYDLLWNDKKVIHKSKTDNIYLYDRYGRCLDVMDNGL